MTTKRKREDNPEVSSPYGLRKLLSLAITNDASAEVAILHIMEDHARSIAADLDWSVHFVWTQNYITLSIP